MAINVDIKKGKNEHPTSFIKRFSRKFRDTNIQRKIRNDRFFKRKPSKLRKKQGAMARIETAIYYGKLRKEGKIEERRPRRR